MWITRGPAGPRMRVLGFLEWARRPMFAVSHVGGLPDEPPVAATGTGLPTDAQQRTRAMGKLRAAVVGCGAAGIANHIPWYRRNEHVDLVGLVDPNTAQAEWASARWGGRPYAGLTDMLEAERPDVVSIASPVHLHHPQTLRALESGCHVLCEKPVGRTPGECREMTRAAREKGLIFGAALDKRFSPVFQRAHELIRSGGIGTPRFFRVHWTATVQAWPGSFRAKRETGGGAFQDIGSHFIDLCAWLMGAEVSSVQGHMHIYDPIREVEDHAVAMLGLANGCRGIIETGWIGPRALDTTHLEEVWVYGSNSVIKATGARRLEPPPLHVFDCESKAWRIENPDYDVIHFGCYQYKRMVDEFVDCVRTGRAFVPGGDVAERTAGVVVGLYHSWFTDTRTDLPLGEDPCLDEIFLKLRGECFPAE